MPTNVKNPVHRPGYPAFKVCSACGGKFTALGLPRHWNHCAAMKARKAKEAQNA